MAKSKSIKDSVIAAADHSDRIAADAEIARLRGENSLLRSRYKAALEAVEAAGRRAEVLAGLSGVKPRKPPRPKRVGKATPVAAILVLSDWHVEEFVDGDTVSTPSGNRTNHYTLEIAEARVAEMTRRAMLMLEHESRLAPIDTVVVAALGDFISNDIHDDTRDVAMLPPLAATRYAGELLSGVIDRVAGEYRDVVVATCNGNHGRSTPKPRIATAHQFSYEFNLYTTLAAANRRKNVRWQVGVGYHNWLDLDGFKVRLHHGESIRSNGGVGGVSISANKAIAQWNRMETAHLDVFGHHHQFSWNYGRYVSNGSLIGWNAFANFIRAEWQPPSQSLVIVSADRGVTKAIPIFCEVGK